MTTGKSCRQPISGRVRRRSLRSGHVRRTQPALLRAVEPERTESPRAGNRLAARFAGMFALRSMPAGDRRHRKEAGRSDPADPVRRLQRDGRRVRARLVAFHVRARMNPMTSKKTTAAAEPVTRALSFSSRTAERERAVFCPAVLPKAVPATRIAPRTRDIAVFDRHGQKERRKRSASVCENPSGLAENGTGFGPAGRRKARFSRTNRFYGYTETDTGEMTVLRLQPIRNRTCRLWHKRAGAA